MQAMQDVPGRVLMASPHPTRDQLDEMDLLMKRMMALPVSAADDCPSTIEQATGLVQIREWADSQPMREEESKLSHLIINLQSPIRESIPTLSAGRETRSVLGKEAIAVPTALLPLAWVNASWDWFFGWFGPAGRFFIGKRGRGLLAWTGLLLIVIGLAWMVALGLGLDLIELSQ
jgi:hypothetical protein